VGTNIGSTKTLSEGSLCQEPPSNALFEERKEEYFIAHLVSYLTKTWELSISVSKSMDMIYRPMLAIHNYTS